DKRGWNGECMRPIAILIHAPDWEIGFSCIKKHPRCDSCCGNSALKGSQTTVGCYLSDQTANSFPAGSRKWKRRPPANANVALVICPPDFFTSLFAASKSAT